MSYSSGESAAVRVYELVKEDILTNRISGGELISEGQVAQHCAVSRTPVREAFLRLEAEGWMRLYPKRGALVVPVGDREARDVVEARRLLETHAVRTVVVRPAAAAGLAAGLRANVDTHRGVDLADLAEFTRVDVRFHQLIAEAGGNTLLSDFYTGLGERQRRMTSASVHRDASIAGRILDDHADLVAAIERGDADAFDTALASHLLTVHHLDADGGIA